MPRVRRLFPNEFRIKLAKEADAGSVTAVAKKYKTSEQNVFNWRNTYREFGEAGFVGVGQRRAAKAKPNSHHLKTLPSDAIPGVLGDVISKLRTKVVAERKRRKETEQVLRLVRDRIQKLIATVEE